MRFIVNYSNETNLVEIVATTGTFDSKDSAKTVVPWNKNPDIFMPSLRHALNGLFKRGIPGGK